MTWLGWIILGLAAGYIGSKIVNNRGEGVLMDIVLGIVGAVFGGWVFHQFGWHGRIGFDVVSLGVAVVGSVLILVIYHRLFGRSI